MVDEAETYIMSAMRKSSLIEGMFRRDITEYPRESLYSKLTIWPDPFEMPESHLSAASTHQSRRTFSTFFSVGFNHLWFARPGASRIYVSQMPGRRPLITAGCWYCLLSRKNISASPHRFLNSATG